MLSQRIGVVVVWAAALAGGIVCLVALPIEHRLRGVAVVMAACVMLTFAVQLAVPQQKGFVSRLVASTVGAFLALCAISLVSLALG